MLALGLDSKPTLAEFRRYRRSGDRSLRNQLVESHQDLAASMARRYAHRGEPFDDLFQVARLGLVKAVERFDPDRNSQFSTFAYATISGEIKRHFRDTTWMIQFSRKSEELSLRVMGATEFLTHKLGCHPTLEQLAAELEVDPLDLLEAKAVNAAYRMCQLELDSETAGGETIKARLATEEPGYSLSEHLCDLSRAMVVLSDRERHVIELRFFENLTQAEIGQKIGLGQSQVGRTIKQALAKLQIQLIP